MDAKDPVTGQNSPLRLVGRIVAAHGIRGEIAVHPLTKDPERFFDLEQVLLSRGETADESILTLTIESVRLHKGRVLLKLAGIRTRNDAESLIDRAVYIRTEEELRLSEGEYFIDSLVGLNVFDQAGCSMGVVSQVDDIPGNPLLTVTLPDGVDVMVPFQKAFVLSVDLSLSRLVLSEAFRGLMEPVDVP